MSEFDLPVGVKVGVGDSVSQAKAVEDGLHKVEDRGIAAGKAMLGLAGAFSKLGQAIQQHQASLERTNVVHQRLTNGMLGAAPAFNALTEAIRREQEMLERIHGPARQYAQDLQVLDSLLERNKISTAEYAAEVAKLNRTIDGAPKNSNVPTPTQTAGSNLGALRGAASALGVGIGAKEIGDLANEYQNLQNRLRYLAGGDMQKVNEMFGQLQGVASRTRGDLSATTEAFVRMSLATKQMGLTTDDTMRLTESLNKAIALSGATGAEAAAGMIQLSQGLASGALRGDELRSVMEQLPAVADVIAKGMGVTRGQLRDMGADGKITAQVIVDSFKKAQTTLDKDFGNTVPTLSQSFTTFKNNLIVTFGELDKSLGISSAVGSALSAVGAIIKTVLIPVRLLGEGLSAIGISGTAAAAGLAGMVAAGPIGAIVGVTGALLAEAGAFDDVSTSVTQLIEREDEYARRRGGYVLALMQGANALKRWHEEQTEFNIRMTLGDAAAAAFRRSIDKLNGSTGIGAVNLGALGKAATSVIDALTSKGFYALAEAKDPWFVAPDKIKAATRELSEYEKVLKALLEPQRKAIEQYNLLGQALMNHPEQFARITTEMGKQRDILLELDVLKAKSVTSPIGKPTNYTAGIDTGSLAPPVRQVDYLTAAWHRELEANQRAYDEMKQLGAAFAPAKDAIVDMFKAWDFNGEKLLDTLDDIAIKLAEMAAVSAITGGLGGSKGGLLAGILGGKTGFDYTVGNDPLQRPGFATGGDFRIPGPGGTDSRLIQFWGTPGETVHVRTPEQQRAANANQAVPNVAVQVVAQMQNNDRDIRQAMTGSAMRSVWVEQQRRYGRRTR